jgi:hypothetical protein
MAVFCILVTYHYNKIPGIISKEKGFVLFYNFGFHGQLAPLLWACGEAECVEEKTAHFMAGSKKE